MGIEHEKFFSVVMFWGECQFKTPMPANVMDRGYTGYIKNKTLVLFSDAEVAEIVAAIKTGMLPKSWKTRREHVQTLHQRFSSTRVCPKCGAELVLRTATVRKVRRGAVLWLFRFSEVSLCAHDEVDPGIEIN